MSSASTAQPLSSCSKLVSIPVHEVQKAVVGYCAKSDMKNMKGSMSTVAGVV